MKLLNCNRMRLVLVGVVAAILVSGGSAKADFTFDAERAEDLPNIGKGESFSHDGLRLYVATSKLADGYGSYDIGVVERESPNAPWGEAINLGPNINTGHMEGWPTISPDDLELYFGRDDGNNWYAMRSTRASKDDPWGPANEYNGVYPDEFSYDGLEKYTYESRDGGYGGWDIWVTTRATIDANWGETVNLGPNVNTSGDQYGPSISSDGLTLFFISITTQRRLHMCVRATKEDPWGPAVDVGSPVNGGWWVVWPEISPDGSTLYCNRGSGHGFTQVSIIPIVDLNSDGIVDSADMCLMVDHWGTDNSLCDIGPMPWGDGVVDVEDLKVLAEHLFEDYRLLVAHWPLDETEGMFAHDSVSGNNDFVMGDPIWQPTGGRVDGALELDGVDDCIITSAGPNPADGPFSVFAWIKGGMPGQTVLSQRAGANWLCSDVSEGNLMTELKGTGQDATAMLSQTVITDGNWHRIGFEWNGSHRTLYVDDVAVVEDTQDSLIDSTNSLYIGTGKGMEPGTFWSGLIDDVRIYTVP